MLKFFVFISRSKTTYIASFLFSDSYFSAAQIDKISLPALTVASRNKLQGDPKKRSSPKL